MGNSKSSQRGKATDNYMNKKVNESKESRALIDKFFPGALTNLAVENLIHDDMQKEGLNDVNTLFAHSTCLDEVNQEESALTQVLTDYWGECFTLGGFGGLAFTGKTGFAAFTAHVPDDGHLFVLYGPHVAIDSK